MKCLLVISPFFSSYQKKIFKRETKIYFLLTAAKNGEINFIILKHVYF